MNFLSKNSNEIAKITVSIENNKQSEKGTGFIVKQNNEDTMAYLFTAKHVFTGSKQNLTNNYTNNLPQKIYFDKKDIQVKLRKKEIFIENNEVFYLSSDIAFAFINLVENSIENIKCVKISDHDFFNKFCGFYAFGYPNTVSEDYGQVLELEFTREAETSLHKSNEEEIPTHTFKELVFSSKRNLGSFKKPGCPTNISDTLGGLSGGGIFLNKESDFLHINSIIIKSDGFTSIIALNLLEEIENINNLVEKECKSDNSIHPLLQINQIFEFDDNKIKLDNIDIEKFKEKIGTIDNETSEQYLDSKKLRYEKQNIEKKRKELAQHCIGLALKFNEEKKYNLATRYFKHAIDLDNSYKPLFLISKDNRNTKSNIAYNKAIIELANEKLIDTTINQEDQYNLIIEKINALENSKDEQYNAIMDFFKIVEKIDNEKLTLNSSLKDNIEKYLEIAKNIINSTLENSIRNNNAISAEYYLYMAEVAKSNKSFSFLFYFLYAARDLIKFLYTKTQPIEDIEYINKELEEALRNEEYQRSEIFKAQTDAEKQIKIFEKLKRESDAILFNDVKEILQKINDIYDKSNDSGILQVISETIESINNKIHQYDANTLLDLETKNNDKNTKKTGLGLRSINTGFLIYILITISITNFLVKNWFISKAWMLINLNALV